MKPDTHFTALLQISENLNEQQTAIFGGMPLLVFRDQAVSQIDIAQAKEMFNQTLNQWENQNIGFNPCMLMPELLVKPRTNYAAEVLRQQAMTNKKIVAVIDRDFLPYLEESWKQLKSKEIVPLDSFLSKGISKAKKLSFIDHVEKHVIFDYILDHEQQLYTYYASHKRYPYEVDDRFMGAEGAELNIDVFWENFASMYWKKIKEVVIFGDEIADYKVENELGHNFSKRMKEQKGKPRQVDKEYEEVYESGFKDDEETDKAFKVPKDWKH